MAASDMQDLTNGFLFFLQEAVQAFVSNLKEQGIFAKEVRSAGVAFHSYYMASIAPNLLAALKKVRRPSWIQQLLAAFKLF